MPILSFRRLVISMCIAASMLLASSRLAADIQWDPQRGWQIQGGAASGLVGNKAQDALSIMNNARRHEDNGSLGSAISEYEKVAKKYPTSVLAEEAYYRAGNLRFQRKEYFKAFSDYQTLVGGYPNTRVFDEVIGKMYRIASLLLDGARNHIWGVFPTFSDRHKAVSAFEAILADAPYGDYAPLCLMNIARGHQYLGEKEEALDALDRLVNTYGSSVLAPEAYLRLGQIHATLSDGPYYDQASTKEAITYFEDFMILYPSDQNIAQAVNGLDQMKLMLSESKIKMADFYFYKRDNYVAARVLYNEAITAYPDSSAAKLAKKRLADVEAKAAGRPIGPKPRTKHFWLF